MARTLSWLDRIVTISRTVQESARSHYDRKDIERLFELQPRAAQQLMAALPCIPVGRAKLVERKALSDLLRHLNESDRPAQTLAEMRAEGRKTVRRKLREFSLQDHLATADSPPRMMTIERGEMRVKFETLEELAEAMLYIATVFNNDLEGFARLYEPTSPPVADLPHFEIEANLDREMDYYRSFSFDGISRPPIRGRSPIPSNASPCIQTSSE